MKNFIIGLVCFLVGILTLGIVMYFTAPKLMLLEDQSPYTFDEAVEIFVQTTEDKGWKIATVHDLQATMEKFDYEVDKVSVFEICHPDYAYTILKENDERVVSALMPCRVAIYEKQDGNVYVSRLNSGLMGKMMSGVVPEVMEKASRESEEIINSILFK